MSSQPIHTMPEAIISRPSAEAWGCTSNPGWVPFPKKIPRRHPLIDTVGRIDDPCDRPVYTDGVPMPAFKAPQEGFPSDVCNLDDYKTDDAGYPPGSAVINVGQCTPKAVQLRIPAICVDSTCPQEKRSIDTCCQESRTLDLTRQKYEDLVPTCPARSQPIDPCSPFNPNYSCTGIIGEIMRDHAPYVPLSDKDKCLPPSLRSDQRKAGNWRDLKPLTGWEYIDGERTCDLYPIDEKLPTRFNNPAWFKGYGCEKAVHPFYVTTTQDYGRFSPNPHTMCQRFHPRFGAFTKIMSSGGMYRNRTLNTYNTKSVV